LIHFYKRISKMFLSKLGICESFAQKCVKGGLVPRFSSNLSRSEDQFNFLPDFDPKDHIFQYGSPQQVWVESLDSVEERKIKIKELSQDVFAVYPRLDIIKDNVVWQQNYSKVNYIAAKTVGEMIHWHGGGKKPWPQKGTGRARHGNTRGPQFHQGGKAHGPRAPKSMYYMLPHSMRVQGLTHTLSVKFIQDDVRVVENLDMPTDDPEFITDLISSRGWGKSTLIVDTDDIFPRNITAATDSVKWVNLMPMYGLNVLSMLKHETLVLTERAAEELTKKLIFALHRTDGLEREKFNKDGPKEMKLKLEQYRPLV